MVAPLRLVPEDEDLPSSSRGEVAAVPASDLVAAVEQMQTEMRGAIADLNARVDTLTRRIRLQEYVHNRSEDHAFMAEIARDAARLDSGEDLQEELITPEQYEELYLQDD